MYAIYAFCREVDDIADKPGETSVKKRGLGDWRDEIGRLYAGRPQRPTARALLGPVRRYELPREEFLAVIDGVEVDTEPVVRMQSLDDLLQYCRKVAGAVGVLSIHAFGLRGDLGLRIAERLGNALQLTNILRDLKEDAALRRLYVPVGMLAEHGISTASVDLVLAHPSFPGVCGELADLARGYYREADHLIAEAGSRSLRPAALMQAVYRETLDRLEDRGWQPVHGPIRLTPSRKLWLALRHGLL